MGKTVYPTRAFFAPGIYNQHDPGLSMMHFGGQIRDQLLHQYDMLSGAVNIYIQMVASREARISGPPAKVPKAIEYLNNAKTMAQTGIIEYGFEQFLQRLAMDSLTIGRTLWHWKKGKEIQYLDPASTYFNLNKLEWEDYISRQKYPANEVPVKHWKPFGAQGKFMSPIFPVMPIAMIDWLIDEHDRAAMDGRKIRDIIIVLSDELRENIEQGIGMVAKLNDGEDVQKVGVPVVTIEDLPQGLKVEDVITRIGLANIPEAFDRRMFYFKYANSIANHIGLAVRYFWNVETGTNRALEEVQQQRQISKGPAFFVRSIQRQINGSGVLRQFGKRVRMGFVEEIDVASRETDARVFNLWMDGFKKLQESTQHRVNVEALMGWFQEIGMLPTGVKLLMDETEQAEELRSAEQGVETPSEDIEIQDIDEKTTPAPNNSLLDYDEISMNLDGQILEKRSRVYQIGEEIKKALVSDEEFVRKTLEQHTPPDFVRALQRGRTENVRKVKLLKNTKKFPLDDYAELLNKVETATNKLKDRDHHEIQRLLSKYKSLENKDN